MSATPVRSARPEMSMIPRHLGHHPGFTLFELLVATGVLVILIAAGVPVFLNLRAAAGSARTVEHLRLIQCANLVHARENNGFFVGDAPNSEGDMWNRPWFSYCPFLALLEVHASSGEPADVWAAGYPEILKCGLQVSVDASPRDDRNFTIAMNMTGWTHHQNGTPVSDRYEWFGCWNAGKILQSRVKNPSRLIMFYESGTFTGYMYDRFRWKGDLGSHPRGMAFRNTGGRCHVVFADGHVGSLSRADVMKDDAATERFFWWDADGDLSDAVGH